MKKEEFNLSEKIFFNNIHISHVKDFIKRLKKMGTCHDSKWCKYCRDWENTINKLAGNSLSDIKQLNEEERANG